MDLSARASTVFVEYIVLVENCLKAFLMPLCYFVVYLSEEQTPLKDYVGAKEMYMLFIETIIPRLPVWPHFYIRSRNFIVFSVAHLPNYLFIFWSEIQFLFLTKGVVEVSYYENFTRSYFNWLS